MISKIRANFLTGAVIIIPLVLTFWVLYFIIDKFNMLLLEPIMGILDRWVPAQSIEVLTKTVILLLLLIFLTFIGFATRIFILRNIFAFGEKVLYKVPMISSIYGTIKEMSFAFFSKKDTIFQGVVLIEYPRKGLYQLGFVISKAKGEVQRKTKETVINVFIPTTPNPTSGVLVFVPEEDAIALDMSVTEAMKMIISGGAIVPKISYGDTEDRSDTFKEERPQGN